ncbi:MAG: 2-phospho-L-lactate transferase [Chloroflexi bacterium]|nr:2-phospho-L-lactate transferase [Chloroflexota bacterium]
MGAATGWRLDGLEVGGWRLDPTSNLQPPTSNTGASRVARAVLALAGGVGGAKLVLGLSRLLPPEALTVVVNTGDDETFHGLHVSPDLDTVTYTLAGLANPETGWGVQGETFQAAAVLERLGAETWFRLGDRDLALHLRRTELLRAGWTLSEVTRELCQRLGVAHAVVPMSDQPVRTVALTDEGELAFQVYFVRRRCEPRLLGLRFDGVERAEPAPAFRQALVYARALVYCPSNPLVSLGPILALPGVREQVERFPGPRVAVSPIVGGQAIKGPAAKMFAELGEAPSCVAVARRLRGLCDVFVLDQVDAARAEEVADLGMRPLVVPTLMASEADKVQLARRVLEVAEAA